MYTVNNCDDCGKEIDSIDLRCDECQEKHIAELDQIQKDLEDEDNDF